MWLEGKGELDTPLAQALLSGDPPSDDPVQQAYANARKKWLNMNAFLAKLWALDIIDEHIYGISTMSMCIEPLPLSFSSGPSTSDIEGREVDEPQELCIEVAAIWVTIAGAKMYACKEILGPKGNPKWEDDRGRPGGSGGTWDGVDGYHPDRWAHWKGIFQEIASGTWRENVIQAAKVSILNCYRPVVV